MEFFQDVEKAPSDPILGITLKFNNDPRKNKINLGVGAYKTEDLQPLVLSSVKKAEELLLKKDLNKEYLPIEGDPLFLSKIKELVLGKRELPQVKVLQTVGGTGALRVGGNFLKMQGFHHIFLPDPTWDNHRRIFSHAGLTHETYAYYNSKTKSFDFDAMCASIKKMPEKSVILLQGSCHNPTGFDPSSVEWKEIAHLLRKHHIFPFFDVAYQGFGDGLEEDTKQLQLFLAEGMEFLIATSYSKNFGLYAERVGALFAIAHKEKSAEHVESQLKVVIRGIYSNPPCHGSRIVALILSDPKLRALWEKELGSMRARIQKMRKALIEELDLPMYDFLKTQKGMFSYTGLSKESVEKLIAEYAIYLPLDGRINVAGLNKGNLKYVVEAIKCVGSH